LHFKNDHNNPPSIGTIGTSLLLLAPQALPFCPIPHDTPLHALPLGLLPIYSVTPSVSFLPGRKRKPEPARAHCLGKPPERLTLWSCFEFAEQLQPNEERSMRECDLGFEPLQRPPGLSGTTAWPKFAIPAQLAVPESPSQVSQPPVLPPRDIPARSPTFLYEAFEKWIQTSAKDRRPPEASNGKHG
jgi:hypothetical protein